MKIGHGGFFFEKNPMTNKIKKFLYTLEHLIPDAHEEIPTFAFYHPLLLWMWLFNHKMWSEYYVCFAKSGWHLYCGLGHILCSVQCRALYRCLLQIVMQAPTCDRPCCPQRRPPTHLRPRLSSAFPLQLESSDSATQLARSIPTDTALQLLGRTLAPTIAVMIVTRTVTMPVWRPASSSAELVTSRVTRDSVRTRVSGTSRGVTRAGRLLTPRTLETAETRETRDSGEDGTRRTWHVRQWLIDEYYRAPAPAAAPPAPHPPQLHPPPRHAALQRVLQRVLQRRPVLQGAGPPHLHHPQLLLPSGSAGETWDY